MKDKNAGPALAFVLMLLSLIGLSFASPRAETAVQAVYTCQK